jgi:ribonuclease-3
MERETDSDLRKEPGREPACGVERLEKLQETIGYRFQDVTLLREAVTHRSYMYEAMVPGVVSNERLEFLGDSILAFVTADYLFRTYPALSEGELTDVRAAVVKTPTLAMFARRMELGSYLLLGRGEQASGGSQRDPLLAAAFEAVIGALYLDGGLEAVRRLLIPVIQEQAHQVVTARRFKDDKSLLQEIAQARLGVTPTYRTVAEEGPSHNRQFTVQVLLGGEVAGEGQGRSKQMAEQRAAHDALVARNWLP